MTGLVLFGLAAVLLFGVVWWMGRRRPEASLFDRVDCPCCGASTPRATGCLSCGTWVGR